MNKKLKKKKRNYFSSSVKSTGAPLDFITEYESFEEYPFLIAIAYQLVDSELIEKWKRYVERGGNLILNCRTAHKNKNGHFFESKIGSLLSPLLGAHLEFFDMLPSETTGIVKTNKEQNEL